MGNLSSILSHWIGFFLLWRRVVRCCIIVVGNVLPNYYWSIPPFLFQFPPLANFDGTRVEPQGWRMGRVNLGCQHPNRIRSIFKMTHVTSLRTRCRSTNLNYIIRRLHLTWVNPELDPTQPNLCTFGPKTNPFKYLGHI